jgi:urease accessory protein
MTHVLRIAALSAPVLLIAGAAEAHTGLGQPMGFASGIAHPFVGADHLLGLLAAGVYAGAHGAVRRIWLLLLAGVGGGMLAGAVALPPAALALGLAASSLAVGLALLFELRLAERWVVAGAVGIGLLHGHVHGAEMVAAGAGASYGAGFMLGTALLLALGAVCGIAGRRYPAHGATGLRAFGGAVGAAALFLAVA